MDYSSLEIFWQLFLEDRLGLWPMMSLRSSSNAHIDLVLDYSLLTRQWRTIQGLLIATSFSFFWSNYSLQFEFPEKIMSHLHVYRLAAHGVLWC